MPNNSIRHNLYAVILLVMMVMQVGVKCFHLHHEHVSITIDCEDCDQHRVHDGHLIDWDGQSDDCMLCQLLSSPYVPSIEFRLGAIVAQFSLLPQDRQSAVCLDQWQSICPRGPPTYLL